ncbi:GNAT family N-acetyltransferase [Alginatibacterium sediminis]|uniref:GNAT family N-acetyltransferase n=1 Tax=Alginatibacterium sediminis TaxID=2164068 RepID=UPI001F406A96|nr:GNAT family N-acetyltransferase [Alginatibacterium sediminis]
MDYRISSDLDQMDFDFIYSFISQSYWAKGMPRELCQRALQNSWCFALFDGNQQQLAFARLITDRATFAYLADVFVSPQHQGKGLGKAIVQQILDQPEVKGLRRLVLATADAHGLYEKLGFEPLSNPERFMQIWQPSVYQQGEHSGES